MTAPDNHGDDVGRDEVTRVAAVEITGDLKSTWGCPRCGTTITATSSPTGRTASEVVTFIKDRHPFLCPDRPQAPVPVLTRDQAPPAGSVVALDWQLSGQEIWAALDGNWAPVSGGGFHRATWAGLCDRAHTRHAKLTLLVASDADTFAAAWRMGARSTADLITRQLHDSLPTWTRS